jgi:hypothetical protein
MNMATAKRDYSNSDRVQKHTVDGGTVSAQVIDNLASMLNEREFPGEELATKIAKRGFPPNKFLLNKKLLAQTVIVICEKDKPKEKIKQTVAGESSFTIWEIIRTYCGLAGIDLVFEPPITDQLH